VAAVELTQLKYFQTLARMQHMTHAARALYITQPSLSQAIARLEAELGVPLFDRRGRTIQLNAFGRAFLEWVDQSFAALESGKRAVADLVESAQGEVRFGIASMAGVSQVLAAFREQYPSLRVRLVRPLVEEMLARLVRGDLDLCLTGPCDVSHVTWAPLCTREVVLAVPQGHRFAECGSIRLSEAADEDFLLLRRGMHFRELTEGFCRQAGFTPHVIFDESATMVSVIEFAVAGMGITFLPDQAWHRLVHTSLIRVHIAEPLCQQTIGLAWHTKHYMSHAARTLRDFIITYFATTPVPVAIGAEDDED
jgi:LysR family transcriptional activator of glutamate synthase operon